MFGWFKKQSTKVVRLPEPTKQDAEYARAMHLIEDECDDRLSAVDFGEAYNFHMDCGDR